MLALMLQSLRKDKIINKLGIKYVSALVLN